VSTLDLRPATIDAIRTSFRPGVRGYGVMAIARELSLPRQSTLRQEGQANPHSRGRKRKLTKAEERRVAARLASNPDATNTALAAAGHHKVKPRTINNILARCQSPFSRKHNIDREPA